MCFRQRDGIWFLRRQSLWHSRGTNREGRLQWAVVKTCTVQWYGILAGCWDITRPNARLYPILMDETILPQSPTFRGLFYSCDMYFWVLMFWFEMGPCYVAWLTWYWVCRQSWVQSFSNSSSAPQVQGLQACTTMTCFISFFGFCSFLILFCLTLKPKQALNMQQSVQLPECWGYMSEILAPYYRFSTENKNKWLELWGAEHTCDWGWWEKNNT